MAGIEDHPDAIDEGDYNEPPPPNSVYIRVSLPDQKTQKCLQFQLDETVWTAKLIVLATLAKDVRDGHNYGFYCPPMNGRAGKFLEEERKLREYPLAGPIGFLEFKYKRRVYRLMQVNPRKLKQLHTKANLKQFLDYVRKGEFEKVSKFINKGLDPNFHNNDIGETPLTLATTLAKPRQMIMTLVNGGAHIDFRRKKDGCTPMHKAAIRGNYDALKVLLELGASPNYRDVRGLTPLYYTVFNDTSPYCLELLLHDHAVIGIKDEQGWSEVHQACRFGRVQHLEHLVFYGADMDVQNSSGNTPLHVSAVNNQESCARVLLFRGANKNLENNSNQTPCQVAAVAGNFELAEVIRHHQEDDVVPFKESPSYSERRKSIAASPMLNALLRSRSDPRLDLHFINDKPPSPASSQYSLPPFNSSDDSGRCASLYQGDSDSPRSLSLCSTGSMSNVFTFEMSHAHSGPNSPGQVMSSPSQRPRSLALLPVPHVRAQACSSHSLPRCQGLSVSQAGSGLTRWRSSIDLPPMYSFSKKRLYAALPGRTFICVKNYHAQEEGELDLKKGAFVEVLSVGEKGFWEGKSGDREGWFPSICVQEVKTRKHDHRVPDSGSVVIRRNTLAALMLENNRGPRTVVLVKGKKGFGFVLRGAKSLGSHGASIRDFKPSLFQPALQYLDNVDKGGVADKAGLKAGDFILEINGENVASATHEHTVKLIKHSGNTIAMKVMTVLPEDEDLEEMGPNRTLPSNLARRSRAPLPPKRNPETRLSVGRARSKSVTEGLETLQTLEDFDRTLALYDDSTDLSNSVEDLTVNAKEKIASVRGRPSSQRLTSDEIEHLFKKTDSGVDTEKSASNLEKPMVNIPRTYANPAELKAQSRRRKLVKQEQAELQRSKSSPNLSQNGDSGIESSSGSSQGEVSLHTPPHLQEYVNTNFSTSEYAEPTVDTNPSMNKDSLGAAYAATDLHPNHQTSNSLFDLRQYARGYVGPVPSQTRKTPSEPRSYSQRSNGGIPPAPSHSPPPPPPPGRKPNTEIVQIQTAKHSDAIYMNIEELKKEPLNIQSSFKPPPKPVRRAISEHIYANPETLQMERNAMHPQADVTYAEVHLHGPPPPPPSGPPPDIPQEKQGVTFADVKIYDNAAKFIQNNPNSMILLTDAANSVPSEDKKRVKVCRGSSTEDEDEDGRKLLSKPLPYYLPEADYEADMTDDTISTPPKAKLSLEKRSSSLPPLPPAPLHDAPRPQSVRKPLTLEEQLRMSGRSRMLHNSGYARTLNRSRSGSSSSTEGQKPVETISVSNTQIHVRKPAPQLGEGDVKAAVAARQARLSYRSETKATDDSAAAVGMRQARTAYRTETKTPDSGMEAVILKNEFNKNPKPSQKANKPNIPAAPPFKCVPAPPQAPEFKPQLVPPPPAFGMKATAKVQAKDPEKPTTNDLLAAIAQRKAKLAVSSTDNPLENIEKKIAENKHTPKPVAHEDHLRLAVLKRRERLANKTGDDVVHDIEQKIRDSRHVSRSDVDLSIHNAQKVEAPKPNVKTVVNEDQSVPGSPIITAPPNSPQRMPSVVHQGAINTDSAQKVNKITVSLNKPLLEQIQSQKPETERTTGVKAPQMGKTKSVPVKSNQSANISATEIQKPHSPNMVAVEGVVAASGQESAKHGGGKARRGILQKSDMLGVTVDVKPTELKSDNASVTVDKSNNTLLSPTKAETFTQRAERLRREYLQRRQSSSSIDITSGSDDDSSRTDGASKDPVKADLAKDMLDMVKGESKPKTAQAKPKRFVLKMDNSGKAKYVPESKQSTPEGVTSVEKQTDQNSYDKLEVKRSNTEPSSQAMNSKNLVSVSSPRDVMILPPPADHSSNLDDLGQPPSTFDAVLPPPSFGSVPPPTDFGDVPPPSNFSSDIDDGIDMGFIPPPLEYSHDDDSSLMSSMSMSTLSTNSSVGPRTDALLSYLSSDRVRLENDYTCGPQEHWPKLQKGVDNTDKFPPPYNSSDIYEELYAPPPPGFVDHDDGPIYEEVGDGTIPPPMEFNSPPKSQTKKAEIAQNKLNSALSDKSKVETFRDKAIHDWTLEDVSLWLESLSLAEYKNSFVQHEIDGTCLVHMGRSDFMDIGVTRVGHRLTMERSIKKVQLQHDPSPNTAPALKPQIIASF
ncbi:SH3 and multiple ankyrin repeat domains protein 2-like isoform X2 [Lineus longissimus]|uniref:SH3 and multiple ankyrin repeat domains protein 2-like isoform X2 n=1 Tax=Lineus longissimus TaxID=88925 RepID=UPI00315D2DC8